MFKMSVATLTVLSLSACGGSRYSSANAVPASNPVLAPVIQTPVLQSTAVQSPVVQSSVVQTPVVRPPAATPTTAVQVPSAPVIVAAAKVPVAVAPPVVRFARGPIQKACQASDRKARSRARCGCIQAVADDKLTSAQQRRGAGYWKNPGRLQEVRQSDNARNEAFWRAWKAYGQAAAAVCKST